MSKKLNKLGVENSLWNNIRANKGSGKAPTKEMLAQEKKITREMAKGGSLSHFYPSNIQAYPRGGTMGGPGLPLNVKHGLEKGTFLINPYYNNTSTGAIVPQTSLGFSTGIDPEEGGWSITGRVGREYPALSAMMNPIKEYYQTDQSYTDPSYYNPNNVPELQSYAEETANKKNKDADFYNNVTQKLMPGALKNVSYGLNATYKGPVGLDGQRFIPEAGIRADYSQSGGLGIEGTFGANYKLGRHNYRQGQLKNGYAAGIVGPYFNTGINPVTGPHYSWGAKAEVDYRPKFFGDVPGMLYGKGAIQGNFAAGLRPQVMGEVGYKMPMQKVAQIDMPRIPMPDMSPITSFLARADKGGEENLQMEGGDPMGGGFGPVNASPIEKMDNPEMGDIYIPDNLNPMGSSIELNPNQEPITDLPSSYDQGKYIDWDGNRIPYRLPRFRKPGHGGDFIKPGRTHYIHYPSIETKQPEYNYKQGGAMNFKSPAAYKAWLAYGHASGQFAKTPGNQPVSIQGKSHKVQHAFGGNMYSMGGRAFADGGQLTQFTEGGTHEQNPLGGIPQGFAPDGKLNLVEQGETKLNAADYVFSDQIKVSKETASLYGLPNSAVGKTFADASKKANRPNSRRENDTIEQVAIQRDLENLMQAQEQQKETEKQAAIAEMQAKYPDVQIVDQAAMQQADAEMQAGMQQPMMDEAAMMQQQQQMAPPAQAPQEMDPAMMAQMQQQGMMSHGGKMYNMGGHMYGAGGGMMALRGLGAAAYGVGEGVLNTLTFGLTDNLTRKGYEKLSEIGDVDERQAGRLDAARSFGNVAGAVTGAAITGGAATKSAISEGIEGLAQGVAALPGTGEKADQIAQGVGQLGSMYGAFTNPTEKVVPQGALEGSKAASKLMNAPQNPFITKAMSVGSNFMAQGGFLGQPTNGMFTNQFAPGGPIGEPVVTFNINGKPVTMSYSQAIANPTLIDMFMPEDADVDGDGQYSPEDVYAAKEALREHFATMGTEQPQPIVTNIMPENVEEEIVVEDIVPEEGMTAEEFLATLEKPEGMSESEFKKMKTDLTKKETLGEMKASPLLAAASALPALYNIGRGIFGKVDQLDAKDYQSRARISPYEMNVDPQLAATQRAYSTAMQAAKNAAPGGGSYLATLGNIATQKQQAIKDLYAQKENFDKAQKLEADKYNAEVEKNNMSQDLAIQQYNAQAKAAKQNMLAEGLKQVGDVATGLTNQDLQEKYLQTIAPEFAGSFKYMSIPEQLAAISAARATRKGNNTTQG